MADSTEEIVVPFRTYTGKLVDLINPRPEDIDPKDVAHHLSIENRFTGATFRPYSVGQHCINVARYVGGWDNKHFLKYDHAKFGLLHDASEAYLKDVHGPLKAEAKRRGGKIKLGDYLDLEEKWTVAIMIRFGFLDLTPDIESDVKEADQIMLATEQRDLCHSSAAKANTTEPMRQVIEPWSWRQTECEYLLAVKELFGDLG